MRFFVLCHFLENMLHHSIYIGARCYKSELYTGLNLNYDHSHHSTLQNLKLVVSLPDKYAFNTFLLWIKSEEVTKHLFINLNIYPLLNGALFMIIKATEEK